MGLARFLFHGSLSSIHTFKSGSMNSMYALIGFNTLISQRRSRLVITLNSPIYLKSQLETLSFGMHYTAGCQSKLNSPLHTKASISLW